MYSVLVAHAPAEIGLFAVADVFGKATQLLQHVAPPQGRAAAVERVSFGIVPIELQRFVEHGVALLLQSAKDARHFRVFVQQIERGTRPRRRELHVAIDELHKPAARLRQSEVTIFRRASGPLSAEYLFHLRRERVVHAVVGRAAIDIDDLGGHAR